MIPFLGHPVIAKIVYTIQPMESRKFQSLISTWWLNPQSTSKAMFYPYIGYSLSGWLLFHSFTKFSSVGNGSLHNGPVLMITHYHSTNLSFIIWMSTGLILPGKWGNKLLVIKSGSHWWLRLKLGSLVGSPTYIIWKLFNILKSYIVYWRQLAFMNICRCLTLHSSLFLISICDKKLRNEDKTTDKQTESVWTFVMLSYLYVWNTKPKHI